MAFNPNVPIQAAIDFGISNTDAIAYVAGEWRRWTRPYTGQPDAELVRAILADGGVDLTALDQLAVTGGRHRLLPGKIGQCNLISVGELQAIGYGGQAIIDLAEQKATPLLVVSAGSGTAIVAARQSISTCHWHWGGRRHHAWLGSSAFANSGSSRDRCVAQQGNSNGVDLSLADVVTGPIGSLPADATAVNFGRLARQALTPSREDLAAALVTLVGQVIGLLAINAARAQQIERIVVIGHMTDMASIRRVLGLVGQYYATSVDLPKDAGYATALGALVYASVL